MGKKARLKALRRLAVAPEEPKKGFWWNWNIAIGTFIVCFLGVIMVDCVRGEYDGIYLNIFINGVSEWCGSFYDWWLEPWTWGNPFRMIFIYGVMVGCFVMRSFQ